MAIDTGALYYLVDPFVQWENVNGKPIVGGHVEVFEAGTDNKIITYADWDGTRHPFKIPLGSDGRAVILVDPGYRYDAYVYDSFNNLVCSRLNIIPLSDGDITIDGMGQVYHDETLSGKGTPNSPLTVISGGKVYGGIYPIDVNNELDMISADNVPLGVQSPLYFAQDDDEGLVIALSSVPVPEGTMNESAFGYQDGQITSYNGTAFSAGNSYEAGSYVDIDGNTINVTGLQPAGNYQSAGDYVVHDELSSYATQDWVENQSYMKEYMESAFYPSTSNPSGYLTEHQDLSDYAKTEDLTAYQEKGNYYSASNPSGFINSDAISAMATTGFVADVSGDITAMIPSTAGLATQDWVTGQGYLTEHQSLDGLMSADLLEISDNKITGYNGTAFAGQGAGDFELSAGSGISIVDYPLEQKTVISVTAQGGNPEVEQAVIDNSATWNTVTAKQDELTFGYHDTAISSINEAALYDNSAHARINTLAGRISDLSSNKLDTTAFSDVSGTFLTAHQDLSDYQTTAGMTAYQPVGDYLTTADSANFYTTANESGFISEVPETYLQNTDLTITDGKVTEISGVPLSAGDELPSGVMNTSALEYNAVNEISAYNGSAIAQYGAEKQFIVHDDTLVHLSNSAQYALGVNLSAVQKLLGIDETVLYSGTWDLSSTTAQELPDSVYNFDKIRITWSPSNKSSTGVSEQYIFNNTKVTAFEQTWIGSVPDLTAGNPWLFMIGLSAEGNNLYYRGAYKVLLNGQSKTNNSHESTIWKIVGIGRKEV
jgi:hypothetical protein